MIKPSASGQGAGRARSRAWLGLTLILLLIAAAVAWRWTPLSEWVDVQALQQVVDAIEGSPVGPLWIIAGFVVGGLIVFPVTLMIVVTVITFGPWLGIVYSLIGALLSAFVTYGVGSVLGRETVRGMTGSRLNRISQQVARRGVLTIVTVRVIPVAPFTIINLVAGASHIGLRDYFLGTVLGMAPGILAIALLTDRIEQTLREPDWQTVLILVAVVVVIAAAGVALRRMLRRMSRT